MKEVYEMEKIKDVIVIGAGPAGMTAAIYASRAGLKTLMLEAGAPGGKLTKTYEISNWPGVQTSNGFALANEMFQHSTSFGAEYAYGNVIGVKDAQTHKEVLLEDGTIYHAKAVIVASGTKEKLLSIPGEEANIGRGVSFCAVCDGAFFKDREVVVIGGGNSALEEAMYLTQFASKVYVVIRRDVFRADDIVKEELAKNDKIEVIRKHIPIAIEDDGMKLTAIKLQHVDTKVEMTIATNGVFPYIGADPITAFISDLKVCDEDGYMLVDEHMETSIKGLYGAGDVNKKILRQVVTAANDGAIAAQSAVQHVRNP
ncbi:MAG: thioredoxin-disulfide reductase [Breznakia sp.]